MAKGYEKTRSRGDAPLMLIFREGTWESLPFEIRLLRPWYGSEVCDKTGITAHQCIEIAASGYCIAAIAIQPPKTGNHGSNHIAPVLLHCAATEVRCHEIKQTSDQLQLFLFHP